MSNKSYRTTKYKLTLASTIIDRILFYAGLVIAFLLYYGAFVISGELREGMISGFKTFEAPIEEFQPLFDELQVFISSVADTAVLGVIIGLLVVVTLITVIHFLYMLPMIIVSHVTLSSAKRSLSNESYDAMGNDRYKCDAVLKLVMHSIVTILLVVISVVSSEYRILLLTIPFVVVVILSIATLADRGNQLKMDSVELEPVRIEPESEYVDFG